MSDKLKSGVSVVPDFNDGEQPSAIKFSAIGAQVKLGLSLLEEAVGDIWGESYPYSSVTNSYLNIPWGRTPGANAGVADLPNQLGRPAIAVNLARLIGPAANLNPQWLEGDSPITGESIDSGVHQFTLLYPPDGAVTFAGDGGVLSTLRASVADLDTAGDYYISGRTVWCVSETIGGTTASYNTNPSLWNGGGNYQGARFNVIPDPNQIASLSSEQIGISGPAADGSYTIQLPLVTHQQANEDSSSSALSAADDPNFDKQLELPTVLTDSLSPGDVIPEGFLFLRNNTTREVYRDAIYEYSDADTIIARSIDLGQPADYNAQEFSIITVGTDVTTSIDDLRRKAMNHNHSGAFGEHQILFEDLIGGQSYAGASGAFTKSQNPSNFLPQYLHRDGYRSGVDGTINDENVMRGDIVMGKESGSPGSYLDFGVSTFGIYFGVPGFGSYIKNVGQDLKISAQPLGGGGVEVDGQLFFDVTAGEVDLTATSGDVDIDATSGNIDATASGDVDIVAGVDFTATAFTGNAEISAANDIELNSGNDIFQSIAAGRVIKMFGGTSAGSVNPGGSGVVMEFDRTIACIVRTRSAGATADVLALEFDGIASPGTSNSWINFYSSGSARRGRVSGAPASAVAGFLQWDGISTYGPAFAGLWPLGGAAGDAQFISGNSDFGEWLPIGDVGEWTDANAEEVVAYSEEHGRFGLPEGMIVYVRDGKIWKSEGGSPMVITCRAILVGNDQDTSVPGEVVSFVGQVPVITVGPVKDGDYLVPLENHCVAVDPNSVSFSEYRAAIGTAWQDSQGDGCERVLCAIGKK